MLAEAVGIKKMVLETDLEIMFRELIMDKGGRSWKVHPFVKDILEKKGSFERVKFSKIKREANKAIDWLFEQVRKGMSLTNWVYVLPSFLVHILNRDGLPTPH